MHHTLSCILSKVSKQTDIHRLLGSECLLTVCAFFRPLCVHVEKLSIYYLTPVTTYCATTCVDADLYDEKASRKLWNVYIQCMTNTIRSCRSFSLSRLLFFLPSPANPEVPGSIICQIEKQYTCVSSINLQPLITISVAQSYLL